MLALQEYEALVCRGCGGYLPETTDPDVSYVADPPHRCFRCNAVQSKQREYADQRNPGALVTWPVKKKPKS